MCHYRHHDEHKDKNPTTMDAAPPSARSFVEEIVVPSLALVYNVMRGRW
jgi:hypothetical protein